MRFIQEYGFSIKIGMEEEYQAWLRENEPVFASSMPDGVKYLGTFSTVYSSEKNAGWYKAYLELDSYGAQDRMAEAAGDANSPIGRLLREQTRFFDIGWNVPWSNGLYKAVVDTTLWDPET